MKNKFLSLLITAIVAVNFMSCEDDKPTPPSNGGGGSTTYNAGDVSLEFQNIAGSVFLDATGATNYVNATGETFNVELFKYYVSNVKLIKDDGTKYELPNTYFLIDANDTNSLKVNLANIPGGKYTGIEYLIGVDSTRNVSGSQTGALDPANGMFWAALALATYEDRLLSMGGNFELPSYPIILTLLAITSLIMISKVRMIAFKFSSSKWADNKDRYTFIILMLPVILVSFLHYKSLFISIVIALLLYSIVSIVFHFIKNHEVQS
jgi:hypothetical protein